MVCWSVDHPALGFRDDREAESQPPQSLGRTSLSWPRASFFLRASQQSLPPTKIAVSPEPRRPPTTGREWKADRRGKASAPHAETPEEQGRSRDHCWWRGGKTLGAGIPGVEVWSKQGWKSGGLSQGQERALNSSKLPALSFGQATWGKSLNFSKHLLSF